ncbi:hypothetical protein D1AOALGA4SA_10934 [Olavius algarvensis Delta 1 endosymbiont]|nr:hypothetical protein D1AOALGA4SA_10934 [Olavius algarvensis Delta 1 endosymbiont]
MSALHWEKRNNVNAREYGYLVEDCFSLSDFSLQLEMSA